MTTSSSWAHLAERTTVLCTSHGNGEEACTFDCEAGTALLNTQLLPLLEQLLAKITSPATAEEAWNKALNTFFRFTNGTCTPINEGVLKAAKQLYAVESPRAAEYTVFRDRLQKTLQEGTRFFDLTTHWPVFYAAWRTNKVQKVLDKDMRVWCDENAYQDYKTGKQPVWRRGRAIWELGRTDYWSQRMINYANDQAKRIGLAQQLEQRRREQGIMLSEDEVDFEFIKACEVLGDHVEPKPGTLASLVLMMGQNMLSDATCAAYNQMYPHDDLAYAQIESNLDDTHELVVVRGSEWPCEKRVCDINFYHFWTSDKNTSMLDLIQVKNEH
jgi:hypothetical protein